MNQPEFNHEMWHECSVCGAIFDRRLCSDQCPECGQSVVVVLSRFLYAFTILILYSFLLSGCILQEHGLRRHRNKVAQEVIQYEHSLSANQDWTRPYRHWNERPKSHWPFND